MLWILLACSGDLPPPPISKDTVTDTGTTLADCGAGVQWNGFGQGFLLTYCTACHATTVTGEGRKGAPEGIDFDTLAGTQDHTERIKVRVLTSGDMPPSGGPSSEELAMLKQWLDCGLPGTEHPLPAGTRSTDLIMGYNIRTELTEQDGEIQVARVIEAPAPDQREGLLRIDTYTVSDTTAQYLGNEVYDADGDLIRAVDWTPPLELLGQDGPQQVQASWVSLDDQGTTTQTWEATYQDEPTLDGHTLDPDARGILLTEAGGDEHGWLLSDTEGIVGRWALQDDQWVEFVQASADTPGFPSTDFPLDVSMPWIETAVLVEVTP
jgi:hypothetical protein